MANSVINNDTVIKISSKTLAAGLTGVVCYTHDTLMVFGHSLTRR